MTLSDFILPVESSAPASELEVDAEGGCVSSEFGQVRWMTSSWKAAAWRSEPGTPTAKSLCDVKAEVSTAAGAPVEEQYHFAFGQELAPNDITPKCAAAEPALLLVRSNSDPRVTDLGHFNQYARLEPLPRGGFTQVRRLANAIYGGVFEYTWCRHGRSEAVAVKRMERNSVERAANSGDERAIHLDYNSSSNLNPEDSLAEIGIMNYLSQQDDLSPYILRMLGAFQDPEYVWLITELAEGGELFGRVASGAALAEREVQRYVWQMLQALAYLHKHGIGHRDVSLENLLLQDGDVKLMDFGMAVRSHSSSGKLLRYFRGVGKGFYRAPECYVPETPKARVEVPRGAKPNEVTMVTTTLGNLCEVRLPEDASPGRVCEAEVWGYAAPPADIFSAGVCFFILNWQVPPWHLAVLGGALHDPAFAFVHGRGDAGLEALLEMWRKPQRSAEAMRMLSQMLRSDPTKRPSVSDCLAGPWLSHLASA